MTLDIPSNHISFVKEHIQGYYINQYGRLSFTCDLACSECVYHDGAFSCNTHVYSNSYWDYIVELFPEIRI